ncbi:WD40-repeat-containing domain superfamily [Arabidopsis suecica]|uniref:WD40-repeat-containing domain superfamily n=2 Tax=Arabidopsis suecica TaxID=45249 RepID=A0A8T2B6L8_ARASU|nr:WD40-repeat-containing domain superfamily [Arabidopsis suecica]
MDNRCMLFPIFLPVKALNREPAGHAFHSAALKLHGCADNEDCDKKVGDDKEKEYVPSFNSYANKGKKKSGTQQQDHYAFHGMHNRAGGISRFTPIPISALSVTGTGELLDFVCSGLIKLKDFKFTGRLLICTTSSQVFSWETFPFNPDVPPSVDSISEGPIQSIRFSLDKKAIAVQRSECVIQLFNRETKQILNHKCKAGSESILGFFWSDSPLCDLAIVKTSGMDLFACDSMLNSLRLQCKTFNGFKLSIVRLPRFEMTMARSDSNSKPILSAGDLHFVTVYGRIYCLQVDREAMLLHLYRFYRDAVVQQGSLPIYSSKLSVNLVDNLLLVHQIDAKVVIIYDLFVDSRSYAENRKITKGKNKTLILSTMPPMGLRSATRGFGGLGYLARGGSGSGSGSGRFMANPGASRGFLARGGGFDGGFSRTVSRGFMSGPHWETAKSFGVGAAKGVYEQAAKELQTKLVSRLVDLGIMYFFGSFLKEEKKSNSVVEVLQTDVATLKSNCNIILSVIKAAANGSPPTTSTSTPSP